jgi:acyl-coenzyme A synthetase/AMP-(fatty) acid ligase
VGCPIGVELQVVDEDGVSLPDGLTGHVQIRGGSVISAYWAPAGRRPGLRPALSGTGWLATGDVGWRDADGFVYLAGRSDDVINRSGEKIYPRQVEEVLLADPAVAAAVVVGRAHPTRGQEPVAFVLVGAGAPDWPQLASRLERRCSTELSRHKRPAKIIVADQLPVGPTGKIRRAEVRRLASVDRLAG